MVANISDENFGGSTDTVLQYRVLNMMNLGADKKRRFASVFNKGRTMEELKRQAGILGKTVLNNTKKADAIVNGSFKVAKVGAQSTFSDRIWQYQDLMCEDFIKVEIVSYSL